MMTKLTTTTGLLALTICTAAQAAPDIEFHDVICSARGNAIAEAEGIRNSDPQLSTGQDFANASHNAASQAAAGEKAMASCHAGAELIRQENTIWIWGYATSSTYCGDGGVAEIRHSAGGAQLQFTLDRNTRFSIRSSRIWQSDSPMGQSSCVLMKAHGDILFRHNLQDQADTREFSVILEPGTYEVNAGAHLWSVNEGEGQIDDWAEVDVKFALEEIQLVGDVDNDGDVDGSDLAKFLGSWGYDNPDTDFNGDGTVDGQDLALLLANWS